MHYLCTHTQTHIDTSNILVERPVDSIQLDTVCQWQCNEIECVNQFNNQQSSEVAPFVIHNCYSIRNIHAHAHAFTANKDVKCDANAIVMSSDK